MDGHGVIAMDGSSSNGQWRRNGRLDGKAIAMGNERALAQWTAQWMADNCHWLRSDAMGGNKRWTAAVITMEDGSSNWQWWCNGQQDGKAIALGNGRVEAWEMAQWQRTIATNTEAAQWEAMQDGLQRQSQWMACDGRAAAMGNGSTKGGGTAE
jgi:hypothetical protein